MAPLSKLNADVFRKTSSFQGAGGAAASGRVGVGVGLEGHAAQRHG